MVSVLLCGLFLMRESREGTGSRVEAAYGDWLAANATRSVPPARVTLAEINDSSLDSEHAWPWTPLEYALFLRAALPYKPAVVAIEPALEWKKAPASDDARQKMEQYRTALHDSVLLAPKLVLGAQLDSPEDPETPPALQPAPLLPGKNVKGDVRKLPMFQEIAAQAEEDYRLSASTGFTNLPQDQGPVIHRAPLVFNYQGEVVPSFILQTLMQWFKVTPEEVQVDLGSHIALGKAISIPINDEGTMSVDFGSTYNRFGEDDLLLAISDQSHPENAEKKPAAASSQPLDYLKGNIVLLARTDAASRTQTSPSLARLSYGEISAAALATVLNHAYTRRIAVAFDYTLIAAMMALSYFIHKFRKRTFALMSFMALLAYFFLGMSVYALWLVWLPFILPVGLLLLVNFFSIFHRETAP